MKEIECRSGLRAEWGVPSHLVPFYGDWHDLLCLDTRSGSVVMIDDERSTLFEWATPRSFQDALLVPPDESPRDGNGVVDVRLDPDLL
jgi:hypothetical protein